MTQRWSTLLFAHWPVPSPRVEPHLPPGLALDVFEGQAWISRTPFRLSHLRFRGVPALPWGSAFPELNLRTYVTRDGKPGVWFFSLDAGSPVAVIGARALYHLPYFNARMECQPGLDGGVSYRCSRRDRRSTAAEFRARYAPTGPPAPAAPGSLDHWLVERYCLYAADARGRLRRAEIHHRPWALSPAVWSVEVNTIGQAAGIALDGPPARLGFSRSLDVAVWWPVRVM
jgi:uncharacterized protein YqjF (DUF2071 family)